MKPEFKEQKMEIVKRSEREMDQLEKSKASQIKRVFAPMTVMLDSFEKQHDALIKEAEGGMTEDITIRAKKMRLGISKIRIEAEKARKTQKEQYLRAGKAIDGMNNVLKWAVTEREENLKEMENHFAIKEKERITKLQADRELALSEYVDDAHLRLLSDMHPDVWDAYLKTKKDDSVARKAAEAKVETDRIAQEQKQEVLNKRIAEIAKFNGFAAGTPTLDTKDDEWAEIIAKSQETSDKYDSDQEAIRVENERLRKEASEREEKEAKATKIREDKEAKAEKERKDKEAKAKAVQDAKDLKAKEIHEAALKKEREEKEAAERKLKDKEAKEIADAKEAEEKVQSDLKKGDKEKFDDMLSDLELIKTKFSFKSDDSKKKYADVCKLLDKVIKHVS